MTHSLSRVAGAQLLFGGLLVFVSVSAPAQVPQTAQMRRTNCFADAAERYGVNESLLRAIAKVESNYDPQAVHYDTDGTHDVGIMQINSSHFDRLRQFNITEDTLFNRPCTNVAVGAQILAGFIKQFGLTWRAVGAYGAGSSPRKESARVAYAGLVSRALHKLYPDALAGTSTVASNVTATTTRVAAAPRMQVLD